MAALLIKNMPALLHRQLKQIAAKHHRSMTGEALALLEKALEAAPLVERLSPALKGKFCLTRTFIDKAKRKGRT